MKNGAPPSARDRATPSSGRELVVPASGRSGLGPVSDSVLPSSHGALDLRRAVSRWLADGRAQGWSARTLKDHRQNLERFCWWLEQEEETPATLDALSPSMVRAFLSYLREPCPPAGAKREARPSTVATCYRDLRAFSNFCIAECLLDGDPLRNVKAPKVPNDQIQPLAADQVQALLDAARRGRAAERDVALILLLLDTGMRVSELCGLRVGDVDRGTGELTVLGKGGKRRRVYMGMSARRSLWRYLETERRQALADEPLFVSIGGHQSGTALTRSGVGHILSDLGRAAGISGVRCSPHTPRHTMAIQFLRNGGSVLELQRLLGHESLEMTKR